MPSRTSAGRSRAAYVKRGRARELILAATAELLEKRPFRELTVDEVMAKAELSRTVFYRHFDGLGDAVLALLQELAGELVAPLDAELGSAPTDRADVERRTQAVLASVVDIYARHGRFLRAVDQATGHDPQLERVYRDFIDHATALTAALLQRAMDAGWIPPANALELARALTRMNAVYLLETLGRDEEFDRELVLATLWHVWRGALRATPASWARHDAARARPRRRR